MKLKSLLFLVLIAAGVAMGYSFRMPIDFMDSPSAASHCTLGVAPGATDGYDLGHDMPAFPPFMSFDAQFVGAGSSALNLRTDIRSDTDSLHIWEVEFSNYSAPAITAGWLSAFVPADTLREMFIGYGVIADSVDWEDMSAVDSLYIPVGNKVFVKLTQDVEPAPEDTLPPVISGWIPEDGDTMVSESTVVAFDVTDETSLDTSFGAIHLWIDTLDVGFLATKTPIAGGYRVQYNPFMPFEAGREITAIAQAQDNATPPHIVADTITFRIAPGDTGTTPTDSLLSLTVMVMLTGFPPPTSMSGSKVQIPALGLDDTTGMTGSVTFDSIPPDTYTVLASPDEYFRAGTTIVMRGHSMIMFTLMEDTTGSGGGIELSGTVTLEGASDHSGSILHLISTFGDSSEYFDTTDVSGAYLFTGLMPGLYNLTASHSGYESDSAFIFGGFADTTINFTLETGGGGGDEEILVIDWDNGDMLSPWGIGPAEWLYELLSGATDSVGITGQDPDISHMDLSGHTAIALVTGTRLGTNEILGDSSLTKLIDFVEGGGNIYWEGPDAGTNYSGGTLIARDFWNLFGVHYGAEGFSASTGNVERLFLMPPVHYSGDTVDFAFGSEADHYVDELIPDEAGTLAYSVGGPSPATSSVRATIYNEGVSDRIVSSFYLGAMDSCTLRDRYLADILYCLLDMTGIDEADLPREAELIRAYPNPFNAACRLESDRPVEIFDLSGRRVAQLPMNSGSAVWDGNAESGDPLPAGVYLAVCRNPEGRIISGRKLFLVR